MKKLLAGLLSLSLLSMSMIQVSAINTDETVNVAGDFCTVIAVTFDGYYLNNNSIVSQEELNSYFGEEKSLEYGDLLYIEADTIQDSEVDKVNQYYFDETFKGCVSWHSRRLLSEYKRINSY